VCVENPREKRADWKQQSKSGQGRDETRAKDICIVGKMRHPHIYQGTGSWGSGSVRGTWNGETQGHKGHPFGNEDEGKRRGSESTWGCPG